MGQWTKLPIDPIGNFIPHPAVFVKNYLIGTGYLVGIRKPTVDCLFCTGYNGADCMGTVTERYCKIKGFPLKLCESF